MANLLSFNSKDYKSITGSDETEPFIPFVQRIRSKFGERRNIVVRALTCGFIIFCATGLVLGTRLWFQPHHAHHGVDMKFLPYGVQLREGHELDDKPCGTNAHEALTRGCYFDLIRTQWLPQACNDVELNNQFRIAVSGIPHYLDKEAKKPITIDEMAWDTHDTIVYTTVAWHRHHCAFTLMKMHRAIMSGANLDSYMDVGHTQHCSLWLMNNTRSWDDVTMRIRGVGFPACVPLETMRSYERVLSSTVDEIEG